MDDLSKKTDEQLRDVMRASIDNQYVPSSIYHKAKQELDFRIQEKSNVTERFVKSLRGDKYIVENNVKHYIPDPETKNALGLEGGKFVQIPDHKLEELGDGVNIESVKSPNTRLIRTKESHNDIFVVFTWPQTHRRHVPDQETLVAMGRRQDQAEVISNEEMAKIPEKEALSPDSKWDPNIIKSKPKSSQQSIHNYYGPVANSGINSGKLKQKNSQKSVKKTSEHSGILRQIIIGIAIAVISGLILAYAFGVGR